MPDKKEIINLLEDIADMMEFKGENIFKVNAYRNGASSIRKAGEDIEQLIKAKKLDEVKGIGKGLQSVIYEYVNTGKSLLYEELKKSVPEGFKELLKVRGLGSKKIKILFDELGISNLGELEYACKENRLGLLKGFGEATQQKILKEIEKIKTYGKFILLNKAGEISDEILKRLSGLKPVLRIAVSGQERRGLEIISELRFVLAVSDKRLFLSELKKIFSFSELTSNLSGKEKGNKILISNGFQVPVIFSILEEENNFCKEMFLTTGSDEFLSGLKIDSSKITGKNEKEIFDSINFPYVIPEMREKEYFEIQNRVLHDKNKELLENSDLSVDHFKGLLHFHTNYSDAQNTLTEMLETAQKTGFEFAAVCDHSKSAAYANGLSEERVLLQKEEIKKLNAKFKLQILQGIESDILQDGSLDYSNDFLKNFDFVVASVHSRFNMEEEEMTKRIIKAVENPYTNLLGHPTGRLLLSRDAYKVNMEKVIDACASNNVAIEINANPHRLDLDWRLIYFARGKGCLFSINPDAHSAEEISYIKYGVLIGRKGGLKFEEVINCFSVEDFRNYLGDKRKGKSLGRRS